MEGSAAEADLACLSIGIPDLDNILGGGLTAERCYLLEGTPGSGKTTIALQFLLEGARNGEAGLYITLSETANELHEVARSHRWSLDDIELFELVSDLNASAEQSILEPAEVELGETIQGVMACVDRLAPSRIVLDSLSELRLLAQNSLRYRRQILALKHFFSTRRSTVLSPWRDYARTCCARLWCRAPSSKGRQDARCEIPWRLSRLHHRNRRGCGVPAPHCL